MVMSDRPRCLRLSKKVPGSLVSATGLLPGWPFTPSVWSTGYLGCEALGFRRELRGGNYPANRLMWLNKSLVGPPAPFLPLPSDPLALRQSIFCSGEVMPVRT